MDEIPRPERKSEPIVNWRNVARRAKRPAPWIAMLVVAAVGLLVLEAYVWQPTRYTASQEK